MDDNLRALRLELDALAAEIEARTPDGTPLNMAYSNWSFPGITRADMLRTVRDAAAAIEALELSTFPESAGELQVRLQGLQFLRTNTIPQMPSSASAVVAAFETTIDALVRALERLVRPQRDLSLEMKKVTQRVRALSARLDQVEPKSAEIASKVARIEQAHDAAEQLPVDLQALSEAKETVSRTLDDVNALRDDIEDFRREAGVVCEKLSRQGADADALVSGLDSAYAAATSHGLAAAFEAKSRSLGTSMRWWVAGLAAALLIAVLVGGYRLSVLVDLIRAQTSEHLIWINILLSLMAVGGPVWFAWLSTKQIGQRFKLAEDYAFKATVARAYEGFRRETAKFGDELESRLLASALDRLDEQPLRFVDPASHSSPAAELLDSAAVRRALGAVPDFPKQISELASQALAKIPGKRPSEDAPKSNVSS